MQEAGQREPWRRVVTLLPEITLGCAVFLSGALLLNLTSNLTFIVDEWDLLLLRPGWGFDQIFEPFAEHTIIAPALIYKLLQTVFGMESARPMQVTAIFTFLLMTVVFFVWARRRTGPWPAVIMTVLILFLGAAFEDLVWAFQVGYFGSLAAGIGALIALDRDDRRGDIIAAILLIVSVSFSSVGIPFIVGAGVSLLANPRDRFHRALVLGVPVVFYAVWWLAWGHSAESNFDLGNLAEAPAYVFNSAAAGFTSIAGLATGDGSEPDQPNLIWGKLMLIVAIGLALWRIRKLGSVPRSLIVTLGIAISFYALAALNLNGERFPTTSRFQLPSVVFLLLVAADLLKGIRIRTPVLVVAGALALLAAINGVDLMRSEVKERWEPSSRSLRASLAGIEAAGRAAPADTELDLGFKERTVPVENYLNAVEDFGSPAFAGSEIPDDLKPVADGTLLSTLKPALSSSIIPIEESGCQRVAAGQQLAIPGESAVIRNLGPTEMAVGLARFADSLGIEVGKVIPRSSASIVLPLGDSSEPWKISVISAGPAVICPGA